MNKQFKSDLELVCVECGNNDVWQPYYVNVDGKTIGSRIDYIEDYCVSCKSETEVEEVNNES